MTSSLQLNTAHTPATQVAFMYPEPSGDVRNAPNPSDIFVFQYWPEQLQDSYDAGYVQKIIPGGSHPLQQWVGGQERTISFDAVFTSEVEDEALAAQLGIPSARYTVDVAAAIAKLQRYTLPLYEEGAQIGVTKPPERLVLIFPNTNLGRNSDEILVFMRSANPTYESWFNGGRPRIATVSLSFSESVQHRRQSGSQIRFIGRDQLDRRAAKYTFSHGNATGLIGSG